MVVEVNTSNQTMKNPLSVKQILKRQNRFILNLTINNNRRFKRGIEMKQKKQKD